jgi:hypothetical protein
MTAVLVPIPRNKFQIDIFGKQTRPKINSASKKRPIYWHSALLCQNDIILFYFLRSKNSVSSSFPGAREHDVGRIARWTCIAKQWATSAISICFGTNRERKRCLFGMHRRHHGNQHGQRPPRLKHPPDIRSDEYPIPVYFYVSVCKVASRYLWFDSCNMTTMTRRRRENPQQQSATDDSDDNDSTIPIVPMPDRMNGIDLVSSHSFSHSSWFVR